MTKIVTTLKGKAKDAEGKFPVLRRFECDVALGDSLEDATKLFGGEQIFRWAVSAAKVDIQAMIRAKMSAEKPPTDDELMKLVREWKPGAGARVRKSKAEKIRDEFSKMTPEEKRALLAQLSARPKTAA